MRARRLLMIHLLATDMDGTLLNSQKEFDNEFLKFYRKY